MGARLSECRLYFNRLNDDISVVRRIIRQAEDLRSFPPGDCQGYKEGQKDQTELPQTKHKNTIYSEARRVKRVSR